MKLWLNFQESLAAVLEPNASSLESWCEHNGGAQSVGMFVGKKVFRLKEVRGAAQRVGKVTAVV